MKEIMYQLQQLYSINKSLDEWEKLGLLIVERDLIQKLLKLHDFRVGQ